MDATFSRDELYALAPADLHDLLVLADGDGIPEQAAALGLDVYGNPSDCLAVMAAVPDWPGLPSPSVRDNAAAQSGVNSGLTPESTAPEPPTTGDGEGSDDAQGLPEPDPAGAASLADLMAATAGTGQPFMAGTYALYADPTGAVVLVTQDPDGSVRRSVVPAKMVRLALALMAGETPKGFGLIGKLLSRG